MPPREGPPGTPPPGAGAFFHTTATLPRRYPARGSRLDRLLLSRAERRLGRAVLACLVLAATAFWPASGKPVLGAADLLVAAAALASGLALWGLGALLCRPASSAP